MTDLMQLALELTMQKPRERPNVWICANPACLSPCWSSSEDMDEVPKASDCPGFGSKSYLFVQVKPMTGRCVRREPDDDGVIDVVPEYRLLE